MAAMSPVLLDGRLPKGTVDLILAYCHNSLNDDSLQDWVPYLKEQGVAIISASPMSMGLMTTQVHPYPHPHPHLYQGSTGHLWPGGFPTQYPNFGREASLRFAPPKVSSGRLLGGITACLLYFGWA